MKEICESSRFVGQKKLNEFLNLPVEEFLEVVRKNNGIKTKYCSQCHSSPEENVFRAHAEYFVRGRRYAADNDVRVPYRAYVCGDHLDVLLTDGLLDESTLHVEALVGTRAWLCEIDEITRKYTAYDSFRQMCRSNPTLRPHPKAGKDEIADYQKLRRAYMLVTGVSAQGGGM